MNTKLLSLALLGALLLPLSAADDAAKAATPRVKSPQPSLAPIVDTPGLPRVLLIGDSISMGYTISVRELLKGEANVHRVPENGGDTANGLAKLDKWLGTA